jgi:biopolymer transport protein TolR
MGMSAGIKKGPKADINITPYIDILLVLLIIFMIVTPVRQMDLRAKLPEPAPSRRIIPPRPDVIVVSVGDRFQISINRTPTEMGLLSSRLHEIYSRRPNKDMFISASSKLPYGDVVKVIDIAKGAGVAEIGLLGEELH